MQYMTYLLIQDKLTKGVNLPLRQFSLKTKDHVIHFLPHGTVTTNTSFELNLEWTSMSQVYL